MHSDKQADFSKPYGISIEELKRQAKQKRIEYFAGLAMNALMVDDELGLVAPATVAKQAKEYAIAMLNELDKPNATS